MRGGVLQKGCYKKGCYKKSSRHHCPYGAGASGAAGEAAGAGRGARAAGGGDPRRGGGPDSQLEQPHGADQGAPRGGFEGDQAAAEQVRGEGHRRQRVRGEVPELGGGGAGC